MDEQRGWWSRSDESVARDRRVTIDEDDDSWLDDFEFADDQRGRDAIGSVWGRWGYGGSTDKTLRIVRAQRVVQGFVDTFATGDKRYKVTFDESVKTAGTDFKARNVVVSHKPLFDPTLSSEEANTILTAMAVHESSHVRYGRKTAKAIEGHSDPRARRLSNILDDVRIERRFVADYPGYADVFAPAIDYVASSFSPELITDDDERLESLNFVVCAVRYPRHVVWSSRIADRDWWQDWSERGSERDTTAWHLAAIEEGLRKLDEMKEPEPEPEPEQSAETPTESDESESDSSDQDQSSPDAGVDQPESDESDESESESDQDDDASSPTDEPDRPMAGPTDVDDFDDEPDPIFADCLADGVDGAADRNDETSGIDSDAAEREVVRGQALTEDGEGEVYWGPGGIARGKHQIASAAGASAAIRAAFVRNRTGHFGTQHALRSGRLDNAGLHRIASDDLRLFSRRTAQSVAHYRVWLMVDCSGSMKGARVTQAAAVAHALASATRQLPNVSLDVWGWTDGWKLNAEFGAVRVYAEGEPLENIGYLETIPMGWTPDNATIKWAAKAIKQAARPGEVPLIIVASDGAGNLEVDTVKEARRSGVEVLSVAFGGGVRRQWQEQRYGAHGFVPWLGSISATARPLGRIIGRLATGKSVR